MNRIIKYNGLLRIAGVFIGIPLVVWCLALSRTAVLWREYTTGKARLELLGDHTAAVRPGRIKEQEAMVSNGRILEKIGGVVEDNKVMICGYTPVFTEREGEWNIYTGELELAGDYISLLKVADYVENHRELGKIRSVSFRLSKQYPRRESRLCMTVWVQQIEKHK